MKSMLALLIVALIFGTLVAACAPSAAPPPAPTQPPGAPRPGPERAEPGYQQKWETVLAEARKEGQLNLYVSANWGADLRAATTRVFKEKYGIDIQFTPFGGSDLVVRAREENRASMFVADVFGAGTTTFLLSMKPADLLGPIEPMLILPEVTDPKAWEGGQLFTFDKDHMMVNMLRVINRSVVYNKEQVKEEEIGSYRDFLNPKFKGKLTMPDPTSSGPGGWFANHLTDVFGYDEGIKFLRELLVTQQMVIQRDARLHMESVARGKYWVALGGGTQYISDFLAMGAPIAIKVPKEGDGGGTSFGGLAVPVKSPHPNATAVFVNWLLTKEGQSIFATYTGNPSRRLDASTEKVNPIFLPMPGEKVAWDTAEFTLRNARVMQAAREIVAETQK